MWHCDLQFCNVVRISHYYRLTCRNYGRQVQVLTYLWTSPTTPDVCILKWAQLNLKGNSGFETFFLLEDVLKAKLILNAKVFKLFIWKSIMIIGFFIRIFFSLDKKRNPIKVNQVTQRKNRKSRNFGTIEIWFRAQIRGFVNRA